MVTGLIAWRSGTRRGLSAGILYAVVQTLLLVGWPLAPVGAATPALTLDPASGPCGSRIVIRGAGFPPGEPIDLGERRTAPTPRQGSQIAVARAGADGTFAVELALLGCGLDPEGAEITIFAVRRPADPRDNGTVLASAIFTLSTAPRCFPETGYCVAGRFLRHWQANGGLARNGYPLSDVFVQRLEDGREYAVQYFERVRLEAHEEIGNVLLGQFGRRILAAVPDAPTAPVPPAGGTRYSRHFPETGHNVAGRFLAYWELNGDLFQFGYPLTEEFEQRLEDGKVYLVQYFERARFEYHPENLVPYDVLLGQFGRTILVETTER